MWKHRRKPHRFSVLLREHSEQTLVWREGRIVFKQQPKYLSDNEFGFLMAMKEVSPEYIPRHVHRVDIETIAMVAVEKEDITDPIAFMSHLPKVLAALEKAGIRHGDLTEYAIIPHDNCPIVIDFAESRWIIDPIPPKRPEPDAVLLERAMRKLCTR